MDARRFDVLTRGFSAVISRRTTLRGMIAAVLASLLPLEGMVARRKKKKKKHKTSPPAGGDICTPTTCAAQGKTCGQIGDGCGGTLECGSCAGAQCLACGPDNTCVTTCTSGQICCDQQCVSGVCCTNAECTQPTTPQCTDHACVCIPTSITQFGGQPTCDPAHPDACCSGRCQSVVGLPTSCCNPTGTPCSFSSPAECCSGTCNAGTGCG